MLDKPKSGKDYNKFFCGLASGCFQAGIFNFWDRGLYLSVKHRRKFLTYANFNNPFTGLYQTIFQRSLSAGVYFPLEDIIGSLPSFQSSSNDDNATKALKYWMCGNITGALNGFICNPIAAVKYNFWGKVECGSETFFSTAKDMLKQGGIRPFLVGVHATVLRDIVFGGAYTLFRNNAITTNKNNDLNPTQTWINIFAGLFATILSSPLNYVRNVHYATPPSEKPLPARVILSSLVTDTLSISGFRKKIAVTGQKLRIGWGSLRVGCGMALGSYLYERCKKTLDS